MIETWMLRQWHECAKQIAACVLLTAVVASTAQGQTNLALHKTATMSSMYAAEYPGSKCVDGDRTPASLCATNSEANPWWQVDLGASYALSQVVVYNRAGDYGAREHTLRALLSTDGRSWTTIYTHNGTDFDVLPINAGNRTARYVRVQLAETNYLNLQEVEVYGAGSTQPASPPPPASPTTAAPAGGNHYRVENFVYGAPDIYQNPRNYHDFTVNFTSCSVQEVNAESQQGLETIHVSVCRNNSRLTFTTSTPGKTTVEYDWILLNNGQTVAGAYRQGGTFGPSVGSVIPNR
jgi:hypothetical protein